MPLTTIKINGKIIEKVAQATKVAVEYEKLTGRKLGITGEVGEVLVCKKLGLQLMADPLSAGYDAVKAGKKYQIKTRRVDHRRGKIGRFSKHNFDFAILAILDKNYKIKELYQASYKKLKPLIDQAPRGALSFNQFVRVAKKIFPLK